MEVMVIRSPKRKKTISAKLVGGALVVYLPLGLSREEERKWVLRMKRKIEARNIKKQLNSSDYLKKRFDEFNKKYFGGRLAASSIEFVTNQDRRRGSCTPRRRSIRISYKLAGMPEWVLGYVIMHEMAHLLHPNHSKEFWRKVNEYKYAERARGFLICKGLEGETEQGGGYSDSLSENQC